jgi:Peptidase family C25
VDTGEDVVLPFGVSAETGTLLPGLSDEAIQALFERERTPAPELVAQSERTGPTGLAFAVDGDTDASNLEQAGWGVIFAPNVDPQIKDALGPLIEHRRGQGAAPLVVYDKDGYRPGETALQWLKRRNVRLDIVNPAQDGIPFYLLIVAPPEAIPFEFQYVLDLYWGVGRLWFDTVEEFRRYVQSVIDYETASRVPTSRQLAIFAPEHDFDASTQLFVKQVATPLRDGTGTKIAAIGQRQNFSLRTFVSEEATKANLTKIYRGEIEGGPPALLFSGGHGMAFASGDAAQLSAQGALVCQDWDRMGKIQPQHWFAAADLPPDSRIHGLIHFVFACYGGGVPEIDNFDRLNKEPKRIAPGPFIAKLPQALLGHAGGGALAVLAHVERAWAYSFQGDRGNPQIQGFRDVIGRLLRGERIGQATDTFNTRWAALSTQLAELHVNMMHDPDLPLRPLGNLWVARDDARNFMILGDPAVRLRQEDMA